MPLFRNSLGIHQHRILSGSQRNTEGTQATLEEPLLLSEIQSSYFDVYRLISKIESAGSSGLRMCRNHVISHRVSTTTAAIGLFEGFRISLVPHFYARVSRRIAFVPLFGMSFFGCVVTSDLFERHFPREVGQRVHSGAIQTLPRPPWPPD